MAKQRMLVLRHEFIHLSYSFYLAVFLKLVEDKFSAAKKPENLPEVDEIAKSLEARKSDFMHIKDYRKNIQYLFNLYREEIKPNLWNKNKEVQKIYQNKEVVLSTFAYETFSTLINNKHFTPLRQAITDGLISITYANSQKKEAYIAQKLFSRELTLKHINDVNKDNYVTGMSRDLYNFILKLEDIFQKKQNALVEKSKKDLKVYSKEELFDPKAKFPIEKSSDTFLSHCPEYKNKYLVDFGKMYLNRRIVDKENDPSILRLDLGDSDFKVSVVEINVIMKVLLVGYMSGKIRVVLLYKVGPKTC